MNVKASTSFESPQSSNLRFSSEAGAASQEVGREELIPRESPRSKTWSCCSEGKAETDQMRTTARSAQGRLSLQLRSAQVGSLHFRNSFSQNDDSESENSPVAEEAESMVGDKAEDRGLEANGGSENKVNDAANIEGFCGEGNSDDGSIISNVMEWPNHDNIKMDVDEEDLLDVDLNAIDRVTFFTKYFSHSSSSSS